jgi:hypothetical protein
MKVLMLGVALLFASSTASFANMICWYNAKGAKYGVDDANDNDKRFPLNVLKNTGSGGDYAWGLTIAGGPADCPPNLAAAQKKYKH